MEQHTFKLFLLYWTASCLLLTGAIALFDSVSDPYLVLGIPRIRGINARKPAIVMHPRLIKAYDVTRAPYKTIILGGSASELGMDATDPAWPQDQRPIYNLSLPGSPPYVSYRFLQHATAAHHVSSVILSLEFEYFMGLGEDPDVEKFESMLLVSRDGRRSDSFSWNRYRDIAHTAFSLGALTDSVATLYASHAGESTDVILGDLDMDLRRQMTLVGDRYDFGAVVLQSLSLYDGRMLSRERMADVERIMTFCQHNGISVTVIISPLHADMLEAYALLGEWPSFEDWKRELLRITTRYSTRLTRVRLWDFSGYYSYTTESVPDDGDILYWMPDPLHYSRSLGDLIVRRLFGGGDPQYGTLLTPENIETHLATIREQQRQYRADHRSDVQRVFAIYREYCSSAQYKRVPAIGKCSSTRSAQQF